METLKYTVIKNKKQYMEYCTFLEKNISNPKPTKEVHNEIELLEFLIDKWDEEHNSFFEINPIELLKSLMDENHLKAKDLVDILGVNKSLVSDILNYNKGLSKEIIRKLSAHFKVSQEAFNRVYTLNPTSVSETAVSDAVARATERIKQLKALSARLKSPAALAEIERKPAYKRWEVKLENLESEISRYSLSEDDSEKRSSNKKRILVHK